MKLGLVTMAYREERFMPKFIQHMQNRVDEILVLNTSKPWFGEDDGTDNTANIARSLGASVISHDWANEEEQRNAGQDYFYDHDWVIVLDPDEYISDRDWDTLRAYLERSTDNAIIVEGQYTYWKRGYVADPPKDYQQLIAVRPYIRFVDKRVVNSNWAVAPVWLHHFSWARSNEEVLRKISHYAHANDFNIEDWYKNVWLKWQPGMTDVHPTTPDTLHKLVPAQLPKEIERLDLWP